MHIQILSDLHFEFYRPENVHLGKVQIHPKADVVVMPGDIDKSLYSVQRAVSIAQEFGKPVLWTPGNHEFYSQDLPQTTKQYQKEIEKLQSLGVFVLLQGAHTDILGVRFIGATLWTNFKLYNNTIRLSNVEVAVSIGQNNLNDFRLIKNGEKTFTAQNSVELHNLDYQGIKSALELPFEGKKVVISHHGPHKNSVHEKYRPHNASLNSRSVIAGENTSWMLNPAFCSHLPELVKLAHYWFHGHTHESIDYVAEGCRVVANPRGYPVFDYNGIRWENEMYEPQKLIEIV